MNTNNLILLIGLGFLSILSACKENVQSIHVEYISGNVSYRNGDAQGDLASLNQVYSNEKEFELNLSNGFVILTMDSVNLILPKEDKTIYTMEDILNEFKYSELSVNQKYLTYVTKNIRQTKEEPSDDFETSGIVSRGASFIQAIAPAGACSSYDQEIHFAWKTNMLMDSLRIVVADEEQQEVASINIAPGYTDKAFQRTALNLYNEGTYYWQIIRKEDNPNYNAWTAFDLASLEEIEDIHSQLQTTFSLSDNTVEMVTGAMSCGCN